MPAAGLNVLVVGKSLSIQVKRKSSSDKHIGANRGIGLQFVKSYLAVKCNVTGTIREDSLTDPSAKDVSTQLSRVSEGAIPTKDTAR